MLKYLVVFALVFGLAIYVSIQDEHAAQQPAQKATQPDKTTPSDKANEDHPQKETTYPERNTPNWYGFFRWPLGTTTWAIVLTLMAIAEQTKQTARAANISERAVIASLRPRLEVKHVFLVPDKTITGRPEDGDEWRIGCVIANVGGSKADIAESNMTITTLGVGTLDGLLPPVPPYGTAYSFRPFVIESGERRKETVALGANMEGMDLRVTYYAARKRGSAIETNPIICFGFFRYQDESGVFRLTGFGWSWNAYDMSFRRLNHPNYEYAD